MSLFMYVEIRIPLLLTTELFVIQCEGERCVREYTNNYV